MLPDNILLDIFDFYRKNLYYRTDIWRWRILVHVCRRWRQIIFESPRRLDLRILCTEETPVKKNLGIWPAFPIVVDYRYYGRSIEPKGEGNVIAALRHPDRVCSVALDVWGPQLEMITTAMQESFPVLTHLHINAREGNTPVFPGEFLGGSAPCLQEIYFFRVPFPALPKLLLSANDLVKLELLEIPPTGYISHEAMVVGLGALLRLETFIIEFQSATFHPNRTDPVSSMARTELPALTYFRFKGASEYLEDLVAQIDGPQLGSIVIIYLNQLIDFQVGQLSKFIERSVGPELTLLRHAHITFDSRRVSITRRANQSRCTWCPASTSVYCNDIDWQVSHMAQVLSYFHVTLSAVIHLNLEDESEDLRFRGSSIDQVEWQHLLRQFSAVKTLHVSQKLAQHVALALEDVTEEIVTEVLPSLDLIRVAGQPASSIKKFITARRLSGRPVTVIDTEKEFNQRLKSYANK